MSKPDTQNALSRFHADRLVPFAQVRGASWAKGPHGRGKHGPKIRTLPRPRGNGAQLAARLIFKPYVPKVDMWDVASAIQSSQIRLDRLIDKYFAEGGTDEPQG